MILENPTPTEQDFIDYGVEDITTIPISAFNELSRPFEVLKYFDKDDVPSINISFNDAEIYWAVKINDTIYSNIDNSWEEINESEIFAKGMSGDEIEMLTDFSGVFEEGSISLVGAAKSNDSEVTWWVERVEVDLPITFETGSTS
ncbi:MAG TPA: hypothetical protein VFC79_00460, partial [Tissierellaceae bacterium]|nr:hypothetical protein [Tissierellaceae bacterium]